MKTYETEKNNIPEGATHYMNQTSYSYFAWCRYVDDRLYVTLSEELDWTHVGEDVFDRNIKPIPQAKEVEWVNGLPPVGVECWFNFKSKTPEKCKVKYIGRRVCVYENENGEEYSILLGCVDFSKIETKEEREKREELEAAYDLACAYNENDFVSAEEFKNYHPSLCDKWLAIVRKTGYRKGGE